MGFAQGRAVKNEIQQARTNVVDNLEAFRLQQPFWLPYKLYRLTAEYKAQRYLKHALQHDYPPFAERLAGIANGAGMPLRIICLFNAIEPMLSSEGGCAACPGACSRLAITGTRSVTGETIIARNFDYLPLVQPYYILRDSRPTKGFRAIEFSAAPLIGAIDGMNETGLCITYNYAYTTDASHSPAAPISVLVSQALARCSTVEEAATWIASQPRFGGALLMLADARGAIASLELSSTQHHLRRAELSENILFHTNRFWSDYMRHIQAPLNSRYTASAPRALRGMRLHESAEKRDKRFLALFESHTRLGETDLVRMMADHGPEDVPSAHTPCVHSDYWQTTACLLFFPRSRRIRVSYTNACVAQFTEFRM